MLDVIRADNPIHVNLRVHANQDRPSEDSPLDQGIGLNAVEYLAAEEPGQQGALAELGAGRRCCEADQPALHRQALEQKSICFCRCVVGLVKDNKNTRIGQQTSDLRGDEAASRPTR